MKLTSFSGMNCSLAQTLDVVGERWTLLILRDAFFGARRFDEFQRSLGIARNILSDRLKSLVAEGILERVPPDAVRGEYALTAKGIELQPVLIAMTHWGDKHKANPRGARITFVERETGAAIAPMSVRSGDGRELGAGDITSVIGPGLKGEALLGRHS